MRRFDRWFATTNELRTRGTDILLAAARKVRVERFVAQGYTGWTNQTTGGPVKDEADGFISDPPRMQLETLAAIRHLEDTVPTAAPHGIVLCYSNLYGPAASDSMIELLRKRRFPVIGDGEGVWSWTHVDDAVAAAVAALEHGDPGVYNVTDDESARVCEWLPYLAEAVGARAPMRVPAWLARIMAGSVAVRWMTEGRGASNERANALCAGSRSGRAGARGSGAGWARRFPRHDQAHPPEHPRYRYTSRARTSCHPRWSGLPSVSASRPKSCARRSRAAG